LIHFYKRFVFTFVHFCVKNDPRQDIAGAGALLPSSR